ncbi:FecR family protein [Spirosoma radiotolerans]|uniref:Iron dicitrate transport regulator FecR n=1 Tax=Spirosoma radiotolerans TaxID=1379870 RepID=A0A0E3V983_9BACT|nr:FecR family protein [Spirosoma radiotolerans]AKD56916.1 iron dicitrate transport regulator FecR [Spirosoma radiotolerans]
MKSFDHFELYDFLEDESFRSWVFDQAPAPVAEWWERFPVLFPEKAMLMIQARETLQTIGEDTIEPPLEFTQRNIQQIMQDTEPTSRESAPFLSYGRMAWVAAASVALIVLAWFGWYSGQDKPTVVYQKLVATSTVPMKEVINAGAKTKLVLLADGSSVLLQPDSRISYPSAFASHNKREVYLVGEAFFEVAKNPDKPFFVYADNLITKVLGTSFTVRAYDRKAVDVTVKTGRVSVFTRTDRERVEKQESRQLIGLVLTPNQRVQFNRDESRLLRSLVDSPTLLDMPIQQAMFEFSGTPINQVFAALEKAYGVEIVFDAEVMKNCYLTASLDDEPLFEKLTMICQTLDAQYEQMDGKILITSKGCP